MATSKTFSLPTFLEGTRWTDIFRRKVFPSLIYLRLTLGEKLLAYPKAEGNTFDLVSTPDYPIPYYAPHDETTSIWWDPNKSDIPPGNLEMGTSVPPDEDMGGEDNFYALALYLRNVERALLGSIRQKDGRHVTCHPQDGGPAFATGVVPFTALLGEEQVDHGKYGAVGGYKPDGPPSYQLPIDGENRSFTLDRLNDMLEETWGRANEDDMPFSQSHVILAPRGFILSDLGKKAEPVVGAFRYRGIDYPPLQTRLFFSPLMPYNAIYIFDPKKVLLQADPFCKITSLVEDEEMYPMGNITSIQSTLIHSLLHEKEAWAKMYRGKPAASNTAVRFKDFSWGMKEGHGALLAVRP